MIIKELGGIELPDLLCPHQYKDSNKMLWENGRDIKSGAVTIWGLYLNGKIAGELRAKFISTDAQLAIHGRRAYLYAFRVASDYQNKGLGKRLLSFVINELTKKGYSEFTVGVESDNEAARHIYNELGFTKTIACKREVYESDEYEYDLLLKTIDRGCY